MIVLTDSTWVCQVIVTRLFTFGCRLDVAGPLAVGLIVRCVAAAMEQRDPSSMQVPSLDSIVLERTGCFGSCPAYRLVVSRFGTIHFESLNPDDSGRTASGGLPKGAFDELDFAFRRGGLLRLPDRIADDSSYCAARVTDASTAIVTLFLPVRVKRVVDYGGCLWAPAALRDFETAIDRFTRSSRWVRSPRHRHR